MRNSINIIIVGEIVMFCEFCNKEYKNVKGHQPYCKKNPNRKEPAKKSERWLEAMKNKKKSNQYIKACEQGLPRPTISEETREKLRAGAINQNKTQWTNEQRAKHSNAMREAVKKHPDSYSKNNVCGRVAIIEYNGTKLKGQWELIVAKWLDSHNIVWESEVNPQNYFWEDKWRMYFPDFYLPDYNTYIEVKGYKRDRDIAKWSFFNGDLVVIDASIIHTLDSFESFTELKEKHLFAP